MTAKVLICTLEGLKVGRFAFKFVPSTLSDDCWEWRGSVNHNGYARAMVDGERKMLHRLIYQLTVGSVAKTRVLDHLCRNRRCCNPDHLEPVSMKRNTLRGKGPTAHNANKIECSRGHPLEGAHADVRYRKRAGGVERVCKVCTRLRARLSDARKKHRFEPFVAGEADAIVDRVLAEGGPT